MPALSETPVLPHDLERLIFELAVALHPKTSYSLLCVAPRVQAWIEPLLYKVLMHSGTGVVSTTTARSRRSVHALSELVGGSGRPTALRVLPKYVRHICLSELQPWDILVQLLSLCANTTNLALLHPTPDIHLAPRIPEALGRLSLQRVSLHIKALFPPSLERVDFSHSMFAHITHLDLCDYDDGPWERWSGLTTLAHLTHLSFRRSHFRLEVCAFALAKCVSLRALVLICGSWTAATQPTRLEDELARDMRFVMVVVPDYQLDWENSAWGGGDYWTAAERRIGERRTKIVQDPTSVPYQKPYVVFSATQ
ncbi:hypothetical protein C8R46DRAFT_376950 [Mycena filopes]|nr:hypothetical protein C8R46DRAFT_376950 [Mycena filopes]